MTDRERAKGLSEKISFSDFEWLPEELTKGISESAARTVIMSIIEEKAFVTWDGDSISVMIGPFQIGFSKSDLDRYDDDTEEVVGNVEIELSGEWQ